MPNNSDEGSYGFNPDPFIYHANEKKKRKMNKNKAQVAIPFENLKFVYDDDEGNHAKVVVTGAYINPERQMIHLIVEGEIDSDPVVRPRFPYVPPGAELPLVSFSPDLGWKLEYEE